MPPVQLGLPSLDQSQLIHTQFTILVTAIVVPVLMFMLNMWRDAVIRKRDLEDRRAAREDAALKLELAKSEAVRAARETKDEIVTKIDENTKVNTQQIEVSNQFNAKLTELQQSFMVVRSEAIVEAAKMAAQVAAARDTKLTEAVEQAGDTLERVDENTKKTITILTTKEGHG